ncbi:hypothetical protein CONLIGDRAFT_633549 [Coniochaeta ligniaria NRRL 30616]|uniref:EKC/KEOPS complex subunit BUD32 n=1 Tax=Coniochaeta ligniaria NRRL 30616 TaxID=1408157 RepID=A0A1J7J1M2_9PEZI|nr:hypothetical protein CONLIGDRAFT_633549 [Coniochaeta ligniaria NRRL 30616]
MGIFDDCEPDQRFSSSPFDVYRHGSSSKWMVHDWDQRRVISVETSWNEEDKDFIFEALNLHIDDVPPDTTLIEVSASGDLIRCTSDIYEDAGKVPFFKYYTNVGNIAVVWHELNCLMRIPPHPNIVPFNSLVVDAVDGDDKVVGFTTPFVAGGTVQDNISRVFGMKHLKQLLQVIDYLNLKLGIVHGDISPYNLLIDPETDEIKIFDFNLGSKLGWEGDAENHNVFGYEADRNDVKMAVFTVYEIITRDMHFREENYPNELDVSMVLGIDAWQKHTSVNLDDGVDVVEYRQVLEAWVKSRKETDTKITQWTEAETPIDWPPLPEYPLVPVTGAMRRHSFQYRLEMIKYGRQFLRWQRPASCQLPLPPGQLLLATGQVIDDHGQIIDAYGPTVDDKGPDDAKRPSSSSSSESGLVDELVETERDQNVEVVGSSGG